MGKRSPIERAAAGLWKMFDGHARTCGCPECLGKEGIVSTVAAVTEVSSTAAQGASAALDRAGGVKGLAAKVVKAAKKPEAAAPPPLRQSAPVVTVDGVPVHAEFVEKKGR